MNYKDYFKQRLMEAATFTWPGIFPYRASPDGVGLDPLELAQPPTDENPDPVNPYRKPPPPPQPGAPFDFKRMREHPGRLRLIEHTMPDGSIRYQWIWVFPGGAILYWHVVDPDARDGYWATEGGYVLPGNVQDALGPTVT